MCLGCAGSRGVNVKALQEALGHSQVETTIDYCHAEGCSVPSPLEFIAPASAPVPAAVQTPA